MFARKIVPILLVAGAVHMAMKHSQHRCDEQPGDQPATEGEHAHSPQFRHGPFARHGEWQKRVPPMFEMWHNRAHERAAQQPPPSAPAI